MTLPYRKLIPCRNFLEITLLYTFTFLKFSILGLIHVEFPIRKVVFNFNLARFS